MLTAKLVQMNQSGFNTLVYNLLLDLLGRKATLHIGAFVF